MLSAHEESSMAFTIRGIPQDVADEVRRTRLAPGYGHPAHHEIARGTGPCRCCLRTFEPGIDERLLFTYRPSAHDTSLMAPGPVFIHANHCAAWNGDGFPDGLRSLPLAFEVRADESRILGLTRKGGADAELEIGRLLERTDVG
jgi:hypothetical protein